MDNISILFSIEEIDDLLSNLEQCYSEGYLNAGDPTLSAMKKLQDAYFEWKKEE